MLADLAMCNAMSGVENFVTVRWPITSLPFPNGPGEVVPVDYFLSLSTTAQGNQHILPCTDCFSRIAAMYATTVAEVEALHLS